MYASSTAKPVQLGRVFELKECAAKGFSYCSCGSVQGEITHKNGLGVRCVVQFIVLNDVSGA